MKEYPKDILKSKILNLLKSCNNIETVKDSLNRIYYYFYDDYPLVLPVQIELIDSKDGEYGYFYEKLDGISDKIMTIIHEEYDAFLWFDSDGWCLNNLIDNIDEIVEILVNIPIFNKIPENVNQLKWLIDNKYWKLDENNMPSFSKKDILDDNEVLSWDELNILTGTNMYNMEVLTRKEWKSLCKREESWF